MTGKYIPEIGTSGYFILNSPFDVQVATNERVTLKSVRKISDYIANNEDIKTDVYITNGIESAYAADAQNDVEILGLQSERGHWIYVPVTYVSCYPSFNGIPYRTVSIVIPLQPIPADTDLSNLLSQINDLVKGNVGFDVDSKVVETSKTILVSDTAHQALESNRAINRTQYSQAGQLETLRVQLQEALDKVYALEDYISTHP